jgi:hypothetical protein
VERNEKYLQLAGKHWRLRSREEINTSHHKINEALSKVVE